jgi:hypothetical protein
VIAGAFVLPWRRRGEFVRALAVPTLAIVALRIGWWLAGERMTGAIAWAGSGAYVIVWILFAVACHRLVLLDQRGADIPVVPGWGRRETLFLAWTVSLCVTTWIAGAIALLTIGTVVVNLTSVAFFETVFQKLMYVIATYVFARLAFLLPAAAIDARSTFIKAWRQTRGNGWRMVVVVGVLPWTFGYLFAFIEGDEPGIAMGVAMTVLATVFLVVEISALSLSYKQLGDDGARAA